MKKYSTNFWFQKNESATVVGGNNLSPQHKGDSSALTQWKNVMTWFVREGIFLKFDASEVISVVKENLGTLTAVRNPPFVVPMFCNNYTITYYTVHTDTNTLRACMHAPYMHTHIRAYIPTYLPAYLAW